MALLSGMRAWFGGRIFRKVMIPWLLILPIALIHLIVVIGPTIIGLYFSLTKWAGIGQSTFIGLENFKNILTNDDEFWPTFGHNMLWMLFFLTIPMFMGLFASSLMAQIKRGAMFIRTIIFVPYILPSVISASVWRMLLNGNIGIGPKLASWGIPGLDQAWLGDPRTALPAIAFADNWHWWGFLMILFLTAMQNISPDLYDAAKIDGANWVQEFVNVTLPGIRPTIVFMLMMTAVWSFLVFDYVFLLTQGGPAGSSEVFGTLIYKDAFARFEFGYATALGLTICVFAGFIITLFTYMRRRGWDI